MKNIFAFFLTQIVVTINVYGEIIMTEYDNVSTARLCKAIRDNAKKVGCADLRQLTDRDIKLLIVSASLANSPVRDVDNDGGSPDAIRLDEFIRGMLKGETQGRVAVEFHVVPVKELMTFYKELNVVSKKKYLSVTISYFGVEGGASVKVVPIRLNVYSGYLPVKVSGG